MNIVIVESAAKAKTINKYLGPGYEVNFPENFEEAYIIVSGRGTLQWMTDGEVKEKEVKEGDAIFFPVGTVKHQIVNKGEKPLKHITIGAPPITY